MCKVSVVRGCFSEPISEKRSDENEASDDKYKDISNNNTNNNNNSSSSHSNSRKSVAIKVETASDNESSEILNGGKGFIFSFIVFAAEKCSATFWSWFDEMHCLMLNPEFTRSSCEADPSKTH